MSRSLLSCRLKSPLLQLVICGIVALPVCICLGDQPGAKAERAASQGENKELDAALVAKLKEQAKTRVQNVKVALKEGDSSTIQVVKTPLQTYTDEPLCIDSGTVWVWTTKENGRPLALCKVEHYDVVRIPRPGEWLYCFASLSPGLIQGEWQDGHAWAASKPGAVYRDIPDAPAPGDTSVKRLRQMKQMMQKFSAVFESTVGQREELRLLAQPLLHYSDNATGVIDGALFTATMNGTNPTAMFLIELQQDGNDQKWRFAVAAMTDGGVVVKYDGNEVMRKAGVYGPGRDFETWTYFFEAKTAKPSSKPN